jgi:cell division protein FtsQ
MIDKTVSSVPLQQKRQTLRHQRRSKVWQSLGRFVVVSGLAGGLAWGMTSPYWTITKAQQVQIEGTELMSQDSIRTWLKLAYPLSLWELPTHQLREKLSNIPAIASVKIERQLLPPKVIVSIQERKPVARWRSPRQQGFLDASGAMIPKNYYDQTLVKIQLPKLEVIGYNQQYQQQWQEIYPLIDNLPIKVAAIDWRNPSNLVLKTELGQVYLGVYKDRLAEKLTALVQSRQLSSKIPLARILYIDLSNPDAPTVQLKPQPTSLVAKVMATRAD